MFVNFNAVVVLYLPDHESPLIAFHNFDKHNKYLPVSTSKTFAWTIDGSPVIIGGQNTRMVFCNRQDRPDAELRSQAEQFFADHDDILRTVRIHTDHAQKLQNDLIRLTYHILPRICRYNDIPLQKISLNYTEDGRVFPWVMYCPPADPNKSVRDRLHEMRVYQKSGYLCPECCSFAVRCTESKYVSGDRYHTVHRESWICDDCGTVWTHRRIWSD